jgi:hypothetical protein
MTAYVFPDAANRLAYSVADGLPLYPASGRTIEVFLDQACTEPAVITSLAGGALSSTLTVGADSLIPRFRGPDGVRVLYLTGGYPITPEASTPPFAFSATPPTNPQVNDLWCPTQ